MSYVNGAFVAYICDESPTTMIPGPEITAIATSARLRIRFWLPLGGNSLGVILNPIIAVKLRILTPKMLYMCTSMYICVVVGV